MQDDNKPDFLQENPQLIVYAVFIIMCVLLGALSRAPASMYTEPMVWI